MQWLKLADVDRSCKSLDIIFNELFLKLLFSYVPPSPNRLDEDISEIMQKEGSEDDSQGDENNENEHPSKRMRTESQVWDSSEMFLVETPVSFEIWEMELFREKGGIKVFVECNKKDLKTRMGLKDLGKY